MINSLRLINYKTFENQSLEFKKLTLLSGLNSTGKSSVLQSLLLLRQSYQQELLPHIGLALNGELVRIGTAQDAFCERAKEDYLGFEVAWNDNIEGAWYFSYDQLKKDADVLNKLDCA
jgi:predicted ATPase